MDDKLTRVVDDGVEAAAYHFDGAGRRVAATEGGVARRYLVAPNVGDGYETPQAITDDSGNLEAAYVFAGEHPIAKITAGGVIEYYLQDSMGSVIGGVNAAGSSVASIKYDSFGDVVSATGTAASSSNVGGDFRLHGMWLDDVSGLYHVRARTYDAATGRFLSRDPVAGTLRTPETRHPYVFCNGNPRSWRDPSGKATLMELMTVVAAISALSSVALPALGLIVRRFQGFRDGTYVGPESVTDVFGGIFEDLYAGSPSVLGDAADGIDDIGADDFSAGLGDALTGVPFTDFNGTSWIRETTGGDSVDTSSDAYDAGVLAGIAMQIMNFHPKGAGWLFGKGSPGGSGGLLNANGLARIGWGFKKLKGQPGNFVFRVSIGAGKGKTTHYDRLIFRRNWPGGMP